MNATLKKIIRKRQKPDGSVALTPADVESLLNDDDYTFARFVLRNPQIILAVPSAKQEDKK